MRRENRSLVKANAKFRGRRSAEWDISAFHRMRENSAAPALPSEASPDVGHSLQLREACSAAGKANIQLYNRYKLPQIAVL